jgi:hypothetical protein
MSEYSRRGVPTTGVVVIARVPPAKAGEGRVLGSSEGISRPLVTPGLRPREPKGRRRRFVERRHWARIGAHYYGLRLLYLRWKRVLRRFCGRGDLWRPSLLHGGSSCVGWTSSAQNAAEGRGRGGRTAVELEAGAVGQPTIYRALALLQGILRRAVEWRRIGHNPVKLVQKPKVRRHREVRPLPPIVVERLRAVAARRRKHGARDATLIGLLAYAGLRPQEPGTQGTPANSYSPICLPRISFMISSVPPPIGPRRASRTARSMPYSRI